ncbi:hypothetical protein MKX01_008887 [Papaver californicum]|nr:hypothetical protein MKX01_008887 [Papaver californicum]
MLNNYSISVQAQTRVGYYSRTCPRAETIIRSKVNTHFRPNHTIAVGLLRMHFHDCFVRGCGASILIDGTSKEKNYISNNLIPGYEVIDDAKKLLALTSFLMLIFFSLLLVILNLTDNAKWRCKLVSTNRSARRSGINSIRAAELPSGTDSIQRKTQKFDNKGFNTQDLVTLVGAHTIGTSACQFFNYRLYNFNGTGTSDPTINPSFVTTLQNLCLENSDASTRVALDTRSGTRFDQRVLESDQKLWKDATTQTFVRRFSGPFRGLSGLRFNVEFGRSMVKMSNIEVKTGTQGEIRRICSAVN